MNNSGTYIIFFKCQNDNEFIYTCIVVRVLNIRGLCENLKYEFSSSHVASESCLGCQDGGCMLEGDLRFLSLY